MGKALDLTGQRFGRLTALAAVGKDKRGCILWECICDCGNKTSVNGAKLKNGHTKSCGCIVKDNSSKATHRMSRTRLYRIWQAMKNRCYNENFWAFCHYGGRGITMCDEWRDSFEAFRDWALANGYRGDLSIDRIDNDMGYSPSNCRWASKKTQASNTRKNVLYEYRGEKRTLKEWSELLNINYQTLHSRVTALGWSIDRALTERSGNGG